LEGALEGYHSPDGADGFPAFTYRVRLTTYLDYFKPVGVNKYNGKQPPQQWLCFYSTTIEVASGSNNVKVI